METKGKESGAKGNISENSQLNLCELLADHIGDTFYSPYLGQCYVSEITPKKEHNHIWLKNYKGVWVALPSCGHEPGGVVMLYPSRALYEQYPLDAYTAWMKWREEQDTYRLRIIFKPFNVCRNTDNVILAEPSYEDLVFLSDSNREKAQEAISIFIKQIKRSKSVASLCEELCAVLQKCYQI